MAYAAVIEGQTTWTPTLDGATPGTTTYTSQQGTYTRIGNIIFAQYKIIITAATGTGNAQIGNLPFTSNATAGSWTGSVAFNGSGWSWPAGRTQLNTFLGQNSNLMLIRACGTAVGNGTLAMTNAALTISGSIIYAV